MINYQHLINLYGYIDKLKKLPRSGWVLQGVEKPESVAAHSFGLAFMTLVMATNLELDVEAAVKIALIHDIGESIVGDITPHDGVSKADKQARDEVAMKQILAELDTKGEWYELWLDFEGQRTLEGKLVNQLDKLEAYMQAKFYDLSEAGLREFLGSSDAALTIPELVELRNQLEKTDTLTA